MANHSSGFLLTRCAIYTRQSVVRRGQDVALSSCQLQRELCIEFTRSLVWRGWYPIAEQFDDEGYSGATVARPALERLLDRIEAGEVQRVIVYRVDRLTRKLSDWARLVAVFDRFGVGLTVVSGVLDIEGGSMARFQLNMLATMAEFELDMIGERLADARAAHKAQGRRSAGRVTYGYVADERTKQLLVDPDAAETVRWLFQETATGVSTSKLVDLANQRVALSNRKSPWDSRALLRLLRNPVYRGCLPDGSPGVHEAIIDDELFDKVQAAIDQRRTREPSKREGFDERFSPNVLRGLLHCDRCGHVMSPSMSKALTKKTAKSAPRYYRCRTPDCPTGQVAASVVEPMVPVLLGFPLTPCSSERLKRLQTIQKAWDLMWPAYRRQAIIEEVASLRWDGDREKLLLEHKKWPRSANRLRWLSDRAGPEHRRHGPNPRPASEDTPHLEPPANTFCQRIRGLANSIRTVHRTKNGRGYEGLRGLGAGRFSMFVLSTFERGGSRHWTRTTARRRLTVSTVSRRRLGSKILRERFTHIARSASDQPWLASHPPLGGHWGQ